MKKNLLFVTLIMIVLTVVHAPMYSVSAAAASYIHPIDILAMFDEAHFVGLEDIDITVTELHEMQDYFERENIISASNTKAKNHENIYKWIKKNISYEQSSNRAYDVFTNKKGVCEGFSQLYKVLCHLCAIPNVIVNGKMGSVAHAWNYIYLNEWHEIDITNSIFDDIFKNDLRHYEDEYLTPYLYKDNEFMYYYSHGICAKPIADNAVPPRKIQELTIDAYDNYLPHYFNGYQNEAITELELYEHAVYIDEIYFRSFPNLARLSGKNCSDGIYYGQDGAFVPPKIQNVKIDLPIIEKETFKDLECLEKIEFADSVKCVRPDAVVNCPALKSVVFGNGIEDIQVALSGVTIYGATSVSAEYANKYGLKFVDTSVPTDAVSPSLPARSSLTLTILVVIIPLSVFALIAILLLHRKHKR